jgi:diadenosine tetraphosphate (Ap4A) HIT family hydrolase
MISIWPKTEVKMGRSTGLEPATPGTTNQCSNQLSYDRRNALEKARALLKGFGVDMASEAAMINDTIRKFGYPATLLREYDHWVLLLRPQQVTAGSLILAAKGEARAYGDLPTHAFAEQGRIIAEVEAMLRRAVDFERINYLMLMMVDPHVHFHVIPRYQGSRTLARLDLTDQGWPGPPDLKSAVALDPAAIEEAIRTFHTA